MGNKIYKIHLKYGTERKSLELSPDLSLSELKSKIRSEFGLGKDDAIFLSIGRDTVNFEDHKTLKQAKILNGSKILVTVFAKKPQASSSSDALDSIEENSAKLEVELEELEKSLDIENVKKLTLSTSCLGEQLMKLLEKLDQVQLKENDVGLRSRRKASATKLNAYLDRIDVLKNDIRLIMEKSMNKT